MISPKTVAEVERLLKEEKLSYRETARRVGINRGTVGIIARGQRPDYEALRQARRKWLPQKREKAAQHCPECHALVYLPCVACETRREMAKKSPRRSLCDCEDRLAETLRLNLKKRHRQRYEEIRARRLQAADAPTLAETVGTTGAGDGEHPVALSRLFDVIMHHRSARPNKNALAKKSTAPCLADCDPAMRPDSRRLQESLASV
ncbi:MAG: hypothetical protein ABFC96_05290 [Thermoguttaceae bacterium]